MYPINTILTFTSLTHASAAADLFGKKSIQTWAQVSGDNEHRWRNGFFTEDVFCMPIEKWRIILDTPEKVRWFEPQALDKIEAFVWSNDALICVSGIFIRGAPEQDHFDLVSGGKLRYHWPDMLNDYYFCCCYAITTCDNWRGV